MITYKMPNLLERSKIIFDNHPSPHIGYCHTIASCRSKEGSSSLENIVFSGMPEDLLSFFRRHSIPYSIEEASIIIDGCSWNKCINLEFSVKGTPYEYLYRGAWFEYGIAKGRCQFREGAISFFHWWEGCNVLPIEKEEKELIFNCCLGYSDRAMDVAAQVMSCSFEKKGGSIILIPQKDTNVMS